MKVITMTTPALTLHFLPSYDNNIYNLSKSRCSIVHNMHKQTHSSNFSNPQQSMSSIQSSHIFISARPSVLPQKIQTFMILPSTLWPSHVPNVLKWILPSSLLTVLFFHMHHILQKIYDTFTDGTVLISSSSMFAPRTQFKHQYEVWTSLSEPVERIRGSPWR